MPSFVQAVAFVKFKFGLLVLLNKNLVRRAGAPRSERSRTNVEVSDVCAVKLSDKDYFKCKDRFGQPFVIL